MKTNSLADHHFLRLEVLVFPYALKQTFLPEKVAKKYKVKANFRGRVTLHKTFHLILMYNVLTKAQLCLDVFDIQKSTGHFTRTFIGQYILGFNSYDR